jgi:C-terminal processing protease CtpA/Prc
MNKKRLFMLTTLIFTEICLSQSQNTYSARQVKEDFEYLYRTLDVSHYDLYAHTKKEMFDKEYKRVSESITDSMTLLQIDRLFLQFVALTHEGHCSIDLPFSSYGTYLQNGGTLFPLNVFFKDSNVFVLDNLSADSTIIPGDEIISINGKPIKEVMKSIYRYLPGDNDYFKNATIEAISFPRVLWIVNDEIKIFETGLRKQDRKQRDIIISSIPGYKFEGLMSKRKPLPFSNQSQDFHYIYTVAYLCPGQFYKGQKFGNGPIKINSDLLDNREFIYFLDSCFTLIHNKHTRNLIIDLRGNPGGASTFSNPMVAFFATEPFGGASKFSMRTSEISKNFWKGVNDTSEIAIVKKEILSRENGARFEIETSKYKYQPRTDSLRFNGNVYVLINRFSSSQAIEVPAMIQHYKFGTLVGQRTSPLTDANARQFKLPNTQLTVTFPEAFYDDSSMANGVIPEHLINDDILTEKDEILDYALRLIEDNKDMDRR